MPSYFIYEVRNNLKGSYAAIGSGVATHIAVKVKDKITAPKEIKQ